MLFSDLEVGGEFIRAHLYFDECRKIKSDAFIDGLGIYHKVSSDFNIYPMDQVKGVDANVVA